MGMENDAANFHYNLENIITFPDASGKFIDFILNTGHPMITDYSRVDKEIVIAEDNLYSLGNLKEKKRITTIEDLKKVIRHFIMVVYDAQDKVNASIWRKALGNDSESDLEAYEKHGEGSFMASAPVEVIRLIADQVIFDILYDKYRSDSPCVTLNEYCEKYIRCDWHNSIYEAVKSKILEGFSCQEYQYICRDLGSVTFNALKSESLGVTPALYKECFKTKLKVFIKEEYPSKKIYEEIIEKITNDIALQNDCKLLYSIHQKSTDDCIEILAIYLDYLKNELKNEIP
jgi:hypothetical protein